MRADTLRRLLLVILGLVTVAGFSPFAKGSPADLVAIFALVVGLWPAQQRRALRAPGFASGFFLLAAILVVGTITSPVIRQAAPAAFKIALWVTVARVLFQASAPDRALVSRIVVTSAVAYAGVGVLLGLAGMVWGELPGTQYYPSFPLGFAATRFVGFYPTANDIALVFVLAIFVVPLAQLSPRWRRWSFVLLIAGLGFTWSRLLVPGLLALVLIHPFRGRRPVIGVLILLVIASEWVTHVAISRGPTIATTWVASGEPFGQLGPWTLWRMGYLELKQAALSMWIHQPFFGVGLRGFGPAMVSHVDPEILTVLQVIGTTPHSTYGFVLAELGSLGVVGLTYLGYRLARSGRGRRALWHGLVVILLLAAIDYELQHHRLVYLTVGLLMARRPEDGTSPLA